MSTKIGHFEILSELAKSPTGTVYKANDPESNQTIALKAIQLDAFGDGAQALEHALLAEAESTNILSSPNVSKVFGAGEIEGKFCAAMEYVQGNSIATMLARKEGFSIWDLLDIGRQLCGGLDHASSHKLVHYSLEPAKIMCGWDGTVKILSFGVSSAGNFAQHISEGMPSFLYYMSPEQVRGEATDTRSNLYSLGAMFYEMVTERKAFDRDDMESLRQSITESTPVAPVHVNPKVHPLLSNLIMKALSKDPAQRYQTGRELLDDLEKCKESKPAPKKAEAPKGIVAPAATKAAAQSKFVNASAPKQAMPGAAAPKAPAATSGLARPAVPPASSQPKSTLAQSSKLAMPKASAAAAGVGSANSSRSAQEVTVAPAEIPELDLSDQFAGPTAAIQVEASPPSAHMSAAVADEPQVETFEPQAAPGGSKIAIDPMMAEGGPGASSGTSFSDISELPPLKEIYVAPPPPAPTEGAAVQATAPEAAPFRGGSRRDEKPKVQTREVAQKAIKEIKGVPPKLYMYALGGAGILILIMALAVTYYVHSQGDDEGAPRKTVVSEAPPQQPEATPAPNSEAAPAPEPVQPAEVEESTEPVAQSAAPSKARNAKKKSSTAGAVIIPGQLSIDSTPQGAQVEIDGTSDPSWVTPFALTNVQPGQHTITISKAGFAADTRIVNITAGNRATQQIHLSLLMATLVVKSDPPGANVFVDGHDSNAKTPAQVSIEKGQHVVLVRLSGYLDETMNGQFAVNQTYNFSPTLRQLGNVDSIKTVGGKMSRLFGGKAQPGQATVSIRTQPKGAQIAVNQHMLEKTSPVDVAVDPGSYVIDITLSGYAPVRKIVTATKGGKLAIDETLQPQ